MWLFSHVPISNALPALPAVLIALWQILPYNYCPEVVTISDYQCIQLFTGSESRSGITKKLRIWLRIRVQRRNHNKSNSCTLLIQVFIILPCEKKQLCMNRTSLCRAAISLRTARSWCRPWTSQSRHNARPKKATLGISGLAPSRSWRHPPCGWMRGCYQGMIWIRF